MRIETSSVQNEAGAHPGEETKTEGSRKHKETANCKRRIVQLNGLPSLLFQRNDRRLRFTIDTLDACALEENATMPSKPTETEDLLSYFDIDMHSANKIIEDTPGMNWTTFFVRVCEVRQAMSKDRNAFVSLLEKLEKRPELKETIDELIRSIVEKGATSTHCYCVRLCAQVHELMNGNDPNVVLAPQCIGI
jgi:hypothetical protein